MVTTASLIQMPSDANYPNSTGISVGMSGEHCLMRWQLIIGGTLGSGSPSYQVQVKDPLGVWQNIGTALTAVGMTDGLAFGTAIRLVAANGSSPGTGNNTPRYRLDVNKMNAIPAGK